jgi:hypothetical protein
MAQASVLEGATLRNDLRNFIRERTTALAVASKDDELLHLLAPTNAGQLK